MKFGRILMFAVVAFVTVCGTSTRAQIITTFGSGANTFNIEFVEIKNPGNAADPTGSPNPAGAVNYIYNIGKNEISRAMILAANAAGSLSISMATMGGYSRGGDLTSPATGISWNEAARFVNWLNTSKGYQPAYRASGGGFALWDAGDYNGNNRFRHKNAYYFLPSVDEWYKAAFYDPNKAGGAGYWDYATGSDTAPSSVTGGTTGAVYGGSASGPADITDAGGLSPYGTMGQTGNVWEWNETAADLLNNFATEDRIRRGGSWDSSSFLVGSSFFTPTSVSNENDLTGFRVASVPEPSAVSLLAIGLGGVMALRRLRRKAD